jgi:hypothetical protein
VVVLRTADYTALLQRQACCRRSPAHAHMRLFSCHGVLLVAERSPFRTFLCTDGARRTVRAVRLFPGFSTFADRAQCARRARTVARRVASARRDRLASLFFPAKTPTYRFASTQHRQHRHPSTRRFDDTDTRTKPVMLFVRAVFLISPRRTRRTLFNEDSDMALCIVAAS